MYIFRGRLDDFQSLPTTSIFFHQSLPKNISINSLITHISHLPSSHHTALSPSTFGIQSMVFIPNKTRKLSIYTFPILHHSIPLHIIISLKYIKTCPSRPLCNTFTRSSRKPLPRTTFLPFATFLRHPAPSVPDSSNANFSYLNSKTSPNCFS